MSDQTPPATEDFDAFWATRERKGKSFRFGGEDYTLPPSLPLQFELEARRLQRSKRDQDVQKLAAILLGPDSYAKLANAGMDIEQFMVLLAWAPQVLAGSDVTLAEVADQVAKAQADSEGEADPT